ncbi:MAG: hypothetical protein U0Q47_10560 [Mycobacterium sp.]
MVLWLAQRTDRTSVATLMRCAWKRSPRSSTAGWPSCSTPGACTRCIASVSMRSATGTAPLPDRHR